MTICYICIEENNKKYTLLNCNHSFHTLCLSKIRKPVCPLCRAKIKNIDPKIINKIKILEKKDKRKQELENELAAYYIQLEEMESLIDTITITI